MISAKRKQHLRKKPNPSDSLDTIFCLLMSLRRDDSIFLKIVSATCSQQPRGDEGHFPCACVCFVEFFIGKTSSSEDRVRTTRKGNFCGAGENFSSVDVGSSSAKVDLRNCFAIRRLSAHSFLMYKAFPDGSLGLFVS